MGIVKAQTSLEYLILIGFILMALLPIFYYATSESGNSIRLNEVEDAVNTIAKTADTVYALGPGTKNYVWITLPGGVENIFINNKRITIKLHIFGGVSDIYTDTKANLTGELPTAQGTYRIMVETLESGKVNITRA